MTRRFYIKRLIFAHQDVVDVNCKFTGHIQIHSDRLSVPLKRRKPTVYAVWNDLFHEAVPFDFILSALAHAVGRYDRHKYLILTKRPTRMVEFFRWMDTEAPYRVELSRECWWWGLTVCNQAEADAKIPIFLQVPGKKFLSIEPCLSHINLTKYLNRDKLQENNEGGVYHERERNGVYVSGCDGCVFNRRTGEDLEKQAIIGKPKREQVNRAFLTNSEKGGNVGIAEPSTGDVHLRGEAPCDLRAPCCMDVPERTGNPGSHGDKPQRREPEEQLSGQFRISHETGEHPTCWTGVESFREERTARGEEHERETESRGCPCNSIHVGQEANDPGGDGKAFQCVASHDQRSLSKKDMEASPINCVILGGETGPGARPLHPDWVRSVRDQCSAAGVPFFFKGWGKWGLNWMYDPKKNYEKIPGSEWMDKGIKNTGRLLDGRTHDELPWRKA
jgi:protein gp37